jgi:hypothetical protein
VRLWFNLQQDSASRQTLRCNGGEVKIARGNLEKCNYRHSRAQFSPRLTGESGNPVKSHRWIPGQARNDELFKVANSFQLEAYSQQRSVSKQAQSSRNLMA